MNSVVRTSVISAEPVSVTAMKNWLKIPASVTNDDTDITDLITEAREQCELITNCALVRANYVQYLDNFPGWQHEFDQFGTSGASGFPAYHGGFGYNRHGRWKGEIKIKRPPLVQVQSLWFIGTDGRPYTLNPGQDFVIDVASQPGRIRPIPYTIWPLTLHVPAAVAIRYVAGYAPNSDGVSAGQSPIVEPESDSQGLSPTWQPGATLQQYQFIQDENSNIWIQTVGPNGTTGTGTRPNFEAQAIGGTIPGDGSAAWLNVGPVRGFWTPGTQYSGAQQYVVLDFNSNLQLLNVASLISQTIQAYSLQSVGVSPLAWADELGQLTADNSVANAWRCLGAYNALGNTQLSPPNSPEQQAAVTVDLTLPKVVTRAIKALVTHWYYNREPVTGGSANKVPMHIEQMLGSVTVEDYAPTPSAFHHAETFRFRRSCRCYGQKDFAELAVRSRSSRRTGRTKN